MMLYKNITTGANISHYIFISCKKVLLFALLLALVLLTHSSVIQFNLMYPEQPSIYLINQHIHSVKDLLHIYLHPQLLNQNIPFFRPSGHFLMYQIFVPLLGWHNTKGLIIINLIFLALIGYVLIEIYPLLFPRLKLGAYLAFSLYLMHPALSLVRITIMHFDFAYAFFVLLSLYCFIHFCRKNVKVYQTQAFTHYKLLILSLCFYVIAVTFKEPAVMLGPVLICYFWIYFFKPQSLFHYIHTIFTHRPTLVIMASITLTTLLMGWYLISSWPTLAYPLHVFNFTHSLGTINSFFIDIWGYNKDLFERGFITAPDLAWRTIIFPYKARMMIWAFMLITLVGMMVLFLPKAFFVKKNENIKKPLLFAYKQSILFLFAAAAFFLILPFSWATGGPWHYSLTLLCLNLIMGFSVEYVYYMISKNTFYLILLGIFIVILNLGLSIQVNQVNIKKYDKLQLGKIGIAADRNAVLNPPAIKNELRPNSVIVVEDSSIHNDYLLGNAAYPYLLFLNYGEYDYLIERQSPYFLKFHPTYSGKLFRYAYLMPSLKEELYPFTIEHMDEVPNEIVYNWLVHYENIFCLGYDKNGNWYNKTAFFKHQLLKIQKARELHIHHYFNFNVNRQNTNTVQTKSLTYPDPQLCQLTCDQNDHCAGFVYEFTKYSTGSIIQCHFSASHYLPNNKPCVHCTWFSKAQ